MSKNPSRRLTVVWSADTDQAMRTFLAATGGKKGGISKLIEESVRRYILQETVSAVRRDFANVPAEQLRQMIGEAAGKVRARLSRSEQE
jgi:hypothetical protein